MSNGNEQRIANDATTLAATTPTVPSPSSKNLLNRVSASAKSSTPSPVIAAGATSASSSNRKTIATNAIVTATADTCPRPLIVGNVYRLIKRISSGTFSEIHLAEHVKSKAKVAVKLESTKSKLPQLYIEQKFYQRLAGISGIPIVFFCGPCDCGYNALVMQLLGRNLEQTFEICKRQFSLKTILYVAIQLITRFEAIHRQGIVYRDVKPENFLLGLDVEQNRIFVIDFGLSKSYVDGATGRHITKRELSHYIGTARYISLNAHRRLEQSRRDDLEAIGYVLLYFLRQGKLPWSGFRGMPLMERYQKIYEYKYSIPIETLCHGFPIEFSNYLRYVRSLEFESEPNYSYMQTLFVDLFQRENFRDDFQYDWSNKIKPN